VPQPDTNRSDLATRTYSRILLVKPSSLGDVVHALPVLHGLRRRYPEARIDWLIGSAFAPLLTGHPALTNLILFDRREFGSMMRRPGVAIEFVRFLGRLRRTHYELVIDLQGLFRSGFMTWMTRAPVRIGFRDAREGARWFYTHHLPIAPANTHAVDRNYAVADLLGFSEVPVSFPLPIDQGSRRSAADLLDGDGTTSPQHDRAACTNRSKDTNPPQPSPPNASMAVRTPADSSSSDSTPPLVVVAPGGRWETKRWSADRFAAVIDALMSDGNRCVIVGGPDETERCADIASRCRAEPLNLAGRTSLVELAAVVERAELVLCHDSAVAHLAVALDRPVVCITGPTNPARTGPYRGGDIVRLPLDCAPCYLRRLDQCRHGHRCMTELSESRVIEAVNDRLRCCSAGQKPGGRSANADPDQPVGDALDQARG